ncbi:AtpZ/AtpI family protein [Ferviditalea candida]|uniref:AtpZ/AtpI family protein n=1 Tax=Ferviditalea candida TaxID=3108399 RepID=A0ABU5ZJ29_9BACL|nr:AtpZ/AtpI family protein [Paenibacillaceae bacterium T2]
MSKSNNPWKAAGFVGFIGLDLSLMMLGGFWLGRNLDNRLNSEPAFLIIGVLTGLIAGVFSIVKMIKVFFGED